MRKADGDLMSQDKLLPELKRAIDAVRIAHPIDGTNPAARRTLRRLVAENQDGVQSFKVLYNLGKSRREWFLVFLAHVLDKPLAELQGPWLDNVRANGPVRGGHRDRAGFRPMQDGIDYDSSEQ